MEIAKRWRKERVEDLINSLADNSRVLVGMQGSTRAWDQDTCFQEGHISTHKEDDEEIREAVNKLQETVG